MAPVALSPRALRFLDEASRSGHVEMAGFQDHISVIRSWTRAMGDSVSRSRDDVVVPAEVAEAFLGLIEYVSVQAAKGEQVIDWDDNDVAYIECVGEGIRAAMRPRPAAAI
jgi:hypothetical protein